MKGLFYTLIMFLALLVQSVAYHILPGFVAWPDFALLLAVYVGIRFGPLGGLQFGALVGFLQDSLSYGALGAFMLSKGMIGYIVGKTQEKYINDSTVSRTVMTFGGTVLDMTIYAVLIKTLHNDYAYGSIWKTAPAQMALNLSFSFFFFPALRLLELGFEELFNPAKRRYKTNPYG